MIIALIISDNSDNSTLLHVVSELKSISRLEETSRLMSPDFSSREEEEDG